MSFVHVFIIKDDCIYLVNVHYRSAMNLLGSVDKMLPLLKSHFLDSGYVVVDLNKKVVVNGQSAFCVRKTIGGLSIIET